MSAFGNFYLVTEHLKGNQGIAKCLLSEDASHGEHGGTTILNLILSIILLGTELKGVEVELSRLSTRAHRSIVDGGSVGQLKHTNNEQKESTKRMSEADKHRIYVPHGSIGDGLVMSGDGGSNGSELVTRKSESGVGGQVTDESKHGDSAYMAIRAASSFSISASYSA